MHVVQWTAKPDPTRKGVTIYTPVEHEVRDLMQAGASPTFKGVRSPKLTDKLDFISLMIALFAGTASLPHILIRYYTVKDASAARKSTVVGIGAIGFFYVLTLFLGLGAMTSGHLDPTPSGNNMAAPLLAQNVRRTSLRDHLGHRVHDRSRHRQRLDHGRQRRGCARSDGERVQASSQRKRQSRRRQVDGDRRRRDRDGAGHAVQGFQRDVPRRLGVQRRRQRNLPALVMLLFWPRTTRAGITTAIWVGMLSSLTWLMLSGPAYVNIYKLDAARAIAPFSQPGLVTIPLGFAVLIVVSLMTQGSHEVAKPQNQ